jgi:hypothetical protein
MAARSILRRREPLDWYVDEETASRCPITIFCGLTRLSPPNARLAQAEQLNQEATAAFTEGTEARETAESYVRITVVLATVLFLIAISQRFKIRNVRVGLLLVASALMVYALVTLVTYPRL